MNKAITLILAATLFACSGALPDDVTSDAGDDAGCQPYEAGHLHINAPCADGGIHDAIVQVAETAPVLTEAEAGNHE